MEAERLRANARLKAASTVTTNLGSALVAGAAARWFALGFNWLAPVWALAAAMLIWAGIHMLNDLQVERANV